MKTVYMVNKENVFVGEVQLGDGDLSPLEPDVYLIPAGCFETAPPAHSAFEYAQLVDGAWVIHSIPTPEPDPITAPDPVVEILTQIDTLERQQLMPRATREFMLMFMEANAPAEVLAVNPGYQAVKAFDNEIVALRAQLPI